MSTRIMDAINKMGKTPTSTKNPKWGEDQWDSIAGLGEGLAPLLNLIGEGYGHTNEPYIDRSVGYSMFNPYTAAWGGSIEDLTDDEANELQMMAAQYGVDPMSMFDAINKQYYQQQQQEGGQEGAEEMMGMEDQQDEDAYATGGRVKKKWIQGAINPKHKGYCTPMTKSTCTGRRRALAKTFKKHHGFHKKKAYGGDIYASGGIVKGGEYDLSQREINRLVSQGYKVEYL